MRVKQDIMVRSWCAPVLWTSTWFLRPVPATVKDTEPQEEAWSYTYLSTVSWIKSPYSRTWSMILELVSLLKLLTTLTLIRTRLRPVWAARVKRFSGSYIPAWRGNLITFEAILGDKILTEIILDYQNTDITLQAFDDLQRLHSVWHFNVPFIPSTYQGQLLLLMHRNWSRMTPMIKW